jgi:hypothetical protein
MIDVIKETLDPLSSYMPPAILLEAQRKQLFMVSRTLTFVHLRCANGTRIPRVGKKGDNERLLLALKLLAIHA